VLLRELGVISAAGVPIDTGKHPYGVLAVYQRTRRNFTDEDIRVLQAISNVLGFAIERGHLEGQLRQRADELAEEGRRKDEFLAMLAHELRNPLAPIRNAVQIIGIAGAGNSTVEGASEIINRQIQHMVHLVDDLLDVSRISRGKVQLSMERVDLATILHRAIESAQPLIDMRKHDLTVTVSKPIWLEGDPTRLVQILANLLNNAAKYMDPGGHIWLSADLEDDDAIVRVRDSGIGIRTDLLPHIFDLFVQSDRSLDRSEGGLGIGLTLVRRLVELHGGSVSASSAGQGKGSEFIVKLPAVPAPAAPANVTKPILNSFHGPTRVLVVDDNQDSATSLAILLKLKMHEVRVAYDGITALNEVRFFQPDIVFLDIGLPGKDGYEVARSLRSEQFGDKLLLVAMTGYGQESDRRRSQAAGFDGHLVKPADLAALEEFLKRGRRTPQISSEIDSRHVPT
jgi:signal transduction histidine kinase/ActR/RegA family two-component response regulator